MISGVHQKVKFDMVFACNFSLFVKKQLFDVVFINVCVFHIERELPCYVLFCLLFFFFVSPLFLVPPVLVPPFGYTHGYTHEFF